MASDGLVRALNRIAEAIVYAAEVYRNVNDTIYPDSIKASEVMGVARDQFKTSYEDTSNKQGQSRTYRFSRMMEREDQLKHESEGRRG
ncbi:hypothetical protein [Bifidobacterium platyrrhinorum]|uniref:Uncharacterized protein n=1 Tax=Bifidobacterium platyrrhinorum TaxID=2661628 RepID=A0A6L9SS43_9BIFI|nr:hypothetical protein [Bifidobacterium platyrrhinorum]NEG55407.1 hypothetical protein [Bifidobacterium platyrrhinorum]